MVRTFVGDSTMRSLGAGFRALLLDGERFDAAFLDVFLSVIYFSCPRVVIQDSGY